MFFIMGINQGMKELAYRADLFICERCGRYGRYQVYMTYMYLSLFFIPTFKWGKRYYVKTTCCGAVYELPQDIGRRIARGENLTITPDMLTPVSGGSGGSLPDHAAGASAVRPAKHCANCGYETTEDFEYCPKCGRKF